MIADQDTKNLLNYAPHPATCAEEGLKQFPLDPILDPFNDDQAAEILSVSSIEFHSLKKDGMLQPTCLVFELGNASTAYCSYWDIFSAAIAISMRSFGFSSSDSVDFSFDLSDEVAGILESLGANACLDRYSLAILVQEVLQDFIPSRFIAPNDFHLENTIEAILDCILSIHRRCLEITRIDDCTMT